MPSQLLDACLEVLLYEVSTLILVVVQHNALQQSLWELQLANLLLHVSTNVEQELVVAVSLELLADLVSNLLTESLLVLDIALAKGLVEQLLIDLSLDKARNLSDLESEVASVLTNLLLINLHHGSNLYVALRISLAGIPCDDITQLTTVEELLLVVNLDVLRHQHSVSNLNTTLNAYLAQVTLQHVALFRVESLYLLVVTGTALIHLNLLVNELVVNGNVIERHLVLATQLGLELRSHSDIELEFQRLVALEIQLSLLVAGERLAQHMDFVILDIAIELLAQHLVYHVNLDAGTKLTLNHAHRSLTRTKSGNLCTLAVIFQSLLDFWLIVSRLQCDSHQTIHLIRSFKLNIHLLLYLINYIYVFRKLAAKVVINYELCIMHYELLTNQSSISSSLRCSSNAEKSFWRNTNDSVR